MCVFVRAHVCVCVCVRVRVIFFIGYISVLPTFTLFPFVHFVNLSTRFWRCFVAQIRITLTSSCPVPLRQVVCCCRPSVLGRVPPLVCKEHVCQDRLHQPSLLTAKKNGAVCLFCCACLFLLCEFFFFFFWVVVVVVFFSSSFFSLDVDKA